MQGLGYKEVVEYLEGTTSKQTIRLEGEKNVEENIKQILTAL